MQIALYIFAGIGVLTVLAFLIVLWIGVATWREEP